MDILQETKPKARKNHRCDWCLGTIEKGEVYHYSVQVYDGEIFSWKAHTKCMELAHDLKMFDNDYGEGVGEDQFQETIIETFTDMQDENDLKTYSFQDKLSFVYDNLKTKE